MEVTTKKYGPLSEETSLGLSIRIQRSNIYDGKQQYGFFLGDQMIDEFDSPRDAAKAAMVFARGTISMALSIL